LLDTLVLFAKLHNITVNREDLITFLPLDKNNPSLLFSSNKLSPNFERAAKRAGFFSKVSKKDLLDISPLVLPAILLLKDGQSAILLDIDKKNKKATVLTSEFEEAENRVDIEKLQEEYSGFVILLKKEYQYKNEKAKNLALEHKHWFWSVLWKYKKIYMDVLAASFLINLFVLAIPLFTRNVYDRVIPNAAIDTLWAFAIGIIVVLFLDAILKFLRTYFLEIAGKKSDILMSSAIFEKVLNLKQEHKPQSVGSFANNLKEFESIRSFFNASTISAVIDLPFIVIFLITIFYIGKTLVLIPLTMIMILLIYTFFIKKPMQRSIEESYHIAAEKSSVLIEFLSALETIKSFATQSYAQHSYEEITADLAQKGMKTKLYAASISTVTSFLIQLNTVMLIVYGVHLIKDIKLTMGGLIACVILASRTIAPLGQVASLVSNYEHTKTAYTTLNEIMNLPPEREEQKSYIKLPFIKGAITFSNVSFQYPNESNFALKNCNFSIKPKEKVAIIGKMGSGKTTIEKLILNLYRPSKGSVLLDGVDINQIDPNFLRKNISYVPQDIVLFRGTIKDNITYKNPFAKEEDILKAVHIAGCFDFINKHPLGLDMPVGERGEGISGGQKQSIALSRAFIDENPVLLLDEPSNMMDNTHEVQLINRLKRYIKDKTLFLITHKPLMLELVDRIIVIDSGRVIMDGAKKDVLEKLRGTKENIR